MQEKWLFVKFVFFTYILLIAERKDKENKDCSCEQLCQSFIDERFYSEKRRE